MADITVPANIPAAVRTDLQPVLQVIGPQVLGDRWPEGVDPANLDNAQLGQVFELVTREFWRQQIQAYKANLAAEAARQTAIAANEADPFEV